MNACEMHRPSGLRETEEGARTREPKGEIEGARKREKGAAGEGRGEEVEEGETGFYNGAAVIPVSE